MIKDVPALSLIFSVFNYLEWRICKSVFDVPFMSDSSMLYILYMSYTLQKLLFRFFSQLSYPDIKVLFRRLSLMDFLF